MQTYNEKAGEKVAFLQIKNYCIETFENGQAAMSDGAYQHVALDVEDIESMYQKICNENTQLLQMESKNCHLGKGCEVFYD